METSVDQEQLKIDERSEKDEEKKEFEGQTIEPVYIFGPIKRSMPSNIIKTSRQKK
mgnify:CR=1 FL=1